MCLEGSGSLVTPMVPGMGAAPLTAYGAANVVGGTPVYGTSHLSLILFVLSFSLLSRCAFTLSAALINHQR